MKGWRCLQEPTRNVIWTQNKPDGGDRWSVCASVCWQFTGEAVFLERDNTGPALAVQQGGLAEWRFTREVLHWPAHPCLFWRDGNSAWCTFLVFDTGMNKWVKGNSSAVCGCIVVRTECFVCHCKMICTRKFRGQMEVNPSCCSSGRAATVDEPDPCASDKVIHWLHAGKKGLEKSPDYAWEILIPNTKAQSLGSWGGSLGVSGLAENLEIGLQQCWGALEQGAPPPCGHLSQAVASPKMTACILCVIN